MDILGYNTAWMIWNILLALAALLFGYSMISVNIKLVKYICLILWLLFIPNTIYVLTDIYHLFPQLTEIHVLLFPILVIQYALLSIVGVITFVIGIKQFERFLQQLHLKTSASYLLICLLNFVISFGVILGRFQRTNSWEVFTHPFKVVNDVLASFFTTEHMIYVLSFGFFCNILYFGLRNRNLNWKLYVKNRRSSNRSSKKRR